MKKNYASILIKVFIFCAFMLNLSCAQDEGDTNDDEILATKAKRTGSAVLVNYLYDSKNELSIRNRDHVDKTLEYAKIPFQQTSLATFNKDPKLAGELKVVVLHDLVRLNETAVRELVRFVSEGGHIVITSVGIDKKYAFFAGINADANFDIDTKATGFRFTSNFLPVLKGKQYRTNTTHYGLTGQNFSEDVEILATSMSNDDLPTIIKNKIGAGSAIVFNTEQFSEKQDRGLFFAAILEGLEGIPYPIANVSSIFLDDFPAPLYEVKMEPVAHELDITQFNYYSKVWWRDMLKLAEEEDLAYSAYVCFDYANKTFPPFNFPEWRNSTKKEKNIADSLMLDIKNSRHELALHGYNHVSLTKEEWPSINYMGLSLEAVKKRWGAKSFGKLPVTYVPPSNIIDSTGFAALERYMPSIKYNASIYLGYFDEGGKREFDPEPYNDHIFNFPRITSGYAMTPTKEFLQQSLYVYTGIWSHFIHPDDIYQIPGEDSNASAGDYSLRNKNAYGWYKSKDGSPGLLPRFRDYIKQVKETFPLSRFLKVSEAAKITEKWRNRDYNIRIEKDGVVAKAIKGKRQKRNFWFVYASEENTEKLETFLEKNNITFTKTIILEGYLFNIETKSGEIRLPTFSEENKAFNSEKILAQLEAYKKVKPNQNTINVSEEIELLTSKIKTSEAFNRDDWLQLFTYLGWESKQHQIWSLLETQYAKNKHSQYIKLSRYFVGQSDYPNLATRKRWMLRQLTLQPKNIKLKKDFIAYFGSKAGVSLSEEQILKKLVKPNKTDSQSFYLSLLNENHPDAALKFTKQLEVCDESFRASASTIAWTLANAGNYKKALLWSKCSEDLAEDAIDNWRLQTGEYEFLKDKNYRLYMEYLIGDNDKKAAQELLEVEVCREDLKPIAATIAYTFSGQGSYRKALEWSSCAKDFPKVERLYWFNALKNDAAIERFYKHYTEENDSAEAVKINTFMAEFYMGKGELVNAWKLVEELPESQNKERLRLQLNKDVVYLPTDKQQLLLEENATLFYPEVAAQIEHKLRIREGDFLDLNSKIVTDRLNVTSFGTELLYGLHDKTKHTHSFGLSQYKAYARDLDTANVHNRDQDLYGVVYKFNSKERIEKLNYSFGSRLEFNNDGKAFLHLSAGISLSKDSLFSSLQVSRKPAVTGPAYSLDIYRSQLSIYEELRFKNRFQAVFYVEGNHYDDDDVLDVQANTSLTMDFQVGEMAKLKPYSEISGMLGNTKRTSGFPYWTLDERFYGGLGLGYEYKNPKNSWLLSVDAGYFLDTFSDEFQRYRGRFLMPLTPYLHFNVNAEFYTLKNFYSNNFSFGLKYYFED